MSYSHTGRPSIDPEVLLRILLIGYLYGITSERRLIEDVGMHLAYRWFTGLGFAALKSETRRSHGSNGPAVADSPGGAGTCTICIYDLQLLADCKFFVNFVRSERSTFAGASRGCKRKENY